MNRHAHVVCKDCGATVRLDSVQRHASDCNPRNYA